VRPAPSLLGVLRRWNFFLGPDNPRCLHRAWGDAIISTAEDIPLIIKQIARCVYLAKICKNQNIEESLLTLARRLKQRALELGAEHESLPEIPDLAESNGFRN
jgi:hypothetical protein